MWYGKNFGPLIMEMFDAQSQGKIRWQRNLPKSINVFLDQHRKMGTKVPLY